MRPIANFTVHAVAATAAPATTSAAGSFSRS